MRAAATLARSSRRNWRAQKSLGAEFGTRVRFVSITVEPEVDTPAVLSAYARRTAPTSRDWSFLTGTARQGPGCRSPLRRVRARNRPRRRRPRVPDLARRPRRHAARPVPRLPLRSRTRCSRSPGACFANDGTGAALAARAFARLPRSSAPSSCIAFLRIVGLLVAIGARQPEELGDVNRRAEDLVKLQRKIAAYRQIQQDTTAQLYSVPTALLVPEERALEPTLRQLNQFGYDLDRLQFVARGRGRALRPRAQGLRRVHRAWSPQVVELIRAGKAAESREVAARPAGPLAERLERLTNELVNKAEADMVARVDEEPDAYVRSRLAGARRSRSAASARTGAGLRDVVVADRAGQEMDARFGEIARGRLLQARRSAEPRRARRASRDLNRMSDEIGRL